MKKKIFRATAILVCFSILALAIPGSITAEKKAKGFSFRFLEKPTLLVFSILPFFSPIYDTGKDSTLSESNSDTSNKVKITDGKDGPKPPAGDG
jgi:hypothetical protein